MKRRGLDYFADKPHANSRVSFCVGLFYTLSRERTYSGGNISLPLPLKTADIEYHHSLSPKMFDFKDCLEIVRACDDTFIDLMNDHIKESMS